MNKEKIDPDPEESNLIKRGAAGEIENDFEASAYYSLTQKAPIGWEIKWSKTGNSFSLNKAQVPEKTKKFPDNSWILPVFLLLPVVGLLPVVVILPVVFLSSLSRNLFLMRTL